MTFLNWLIQLLILGDQNFCSLPGYLNPDCHRQPRTDPFVMDQNNVLLQRRIQPRIFAGHLPHPLDIRAYVGLPTYFTNTEDSEKTQTRYSPDDNNCPSMAQAFLILGPHDPVNSAPNHVSSSC